FLRAAARGGVCRRAHGEHRHAAARARSREEPDRCRVRPPRDHRRDQQAARARPLPLEPSVWRWRRRRAHCEDSRERAAARAEAFVVLMNVLGVIPARGGSKGILNKNLALLCGRPLLAYTADAVRASKRLTKTIVSTDDERIAECAKSLGLDVPF